MGFPRYAELVRPAGESLPLAWGVFGAKDELGTWNHVTPEKVVAAAKLIRRGKRFNLNLPLRLPFGLLAPGAHRLRQAPAQTLFKFELGKLLVRDDKVELYPQGSSQWDGLTHIGDPVHGFYNGVKDAQVTQGEGSPNGIEKVTAFGPASRGVMIDLPRHFAAVGRDWQPMGAHVASAADLAQCLKRTGQKLAPGDVLLVRTGWLTAFRDAPDRDQRERLFTDRNYSGLSGAEDMWEFLWDHKVAAVAADSVTVEVWPLSDGKPSLHLAIARLGLTLGEMFDLDALAEDCAETGVHDCFFASSPLMLQGGVGSPPNAMAIK